MIIFKRPFPKHVFIRTIFVLFSLLVLAGSERAAAFNLGDACAHASPLRAVAFYLLANASQKSASRDVTFGENGLQPQTLDVDQAGNIYIGGGNEIWVYNKDGIRISVWQFPAASVVRSAGDGTLLVGRSWEPTLQLRVFDKSGAVLHSIAGGKWLHGDSVGFDAPCDLAFDTDENIWSINTHNVQEAEADRRPNSVWGGLSSDPNGGRIMYFDLKKDPKGEHPAYFGTFSTNPPESGGPPDALHLPTRIAFDPIHKKIFVLDIWGITRWNWPDGKFEARILRRDIDRTRSLLAITPQGTLYLRASGPLEEFDWQGQKLRDLPKIDVDGASDLRVLGDGSLYLCYQSRGIAVQKFSPDGDLILSRGLNIIHLGLSLDDTVYTAGQKIAVSALITDRQKLYGQTLPGLDEIKRSLWIRPYDLSSGWRRLTIETGTDGKDYFTIPVDLRGACQLILSASSAAAELLDSTASSVSLNFAVKSPDAKSGSLTLCTDRNQQLFVSGEWLRANVIGRSVAGLNNEALQIRLIDAKRNVVLEKNAAWTVPAGGSVNLPFDLWLGSGLSLGVYNLTATSPSLGTDSAMIRVGESRENGRFGLFAPLGFGFRTSHETVQGIAEEVEQDGFTHDITRYISFPPDFGSSEEDLEINRDVRHILNADPLLPAPESAELPTRMRLALTELSFRGMHLWPETMGWELDTLNRTDAQKTNDKQNLARWTQWGQKSAAQDGYLWNESNWWGVDEKRFKAQWSQATGQPESSLNGTPQGGNLQEPKPLLSGELLKVFLSYRTYAGKHLYPDNYNTWKNYVHEMRPDSMSTGVPAFYWHNWPEWSSQPLDGIMCYHQVEQICEPYMQLSDGAMMIHNGKPFWAGVEIAPESGTGEYTERQLLPSLMWGSEGLWLNDMGGWQSAAYSNEMLLQSAHDLKSVLEPIGHRLRDTAYRPELGIYYPMAARVQGGNPAFSGSMYVKRVRDALIASFHAHVPAKVVFDEDLKANRFDGLKYLLLPGLQSEITQDDLDSLQRFKKQGGQILLGKNTDDRYASLGTPIDVDFDIEKDYDYGQWWAGDIVIEKRLKVLTLAKQLGSALAPYLVPPVKIEDPEIWYALREGKDNAARPITYLVAVNQNYPDDLQPYQLWRMSTDYDVLIPVVRSAVVPSKFSYAYDLLRGKALKITNGTIELNFQRFAANVIALSSHPLTATDLREAAEPRSKIHSPDFKQAPDVDVFMARDIHQALNAGKKVSVISSDVAMRTKAAAQLVQVGIDAQPSSQPADGVNLVVTRPGDNYSLDPGDVLPVRLTENVPGRNRALLTYTRGFLPQATDAIVMAITDDEGLGKATQTLAGIKHQPQSEEQRLSAPKIQPAVPASLEEDTTKIWGARLATIAAAGSTVAVGAEEWGNNLFLLDAQSGKLRVATKAGRYYNQKVWMSVDGEKTGGEAFYPEDVNSYMEMFDPIGKSLARFARDGIDTHNNWSYADHTTRCDIFSFALSPDGSVVYSGSNLGLSALKSDGTILWRHDYSKLDTSLDLLRNLWASRIALTRDGNFLAEALTHELPVGADYRGTSIIRKVDAKTGNIVWEHELEAVQSPQLAEVTISPDGNTIAAIGHGGLLILRDGKVIRKRPDAGKFHYSHLTWNTDSKTLYAVVDTRGSQSYPGMGAGVSAAQNAIFAFSADGIPQWQHDHAVSVVDLAADPQGGVVFSDGLHCINRLSSEGDLQWTTSTEAVAHLCILNDAIYACDWHGNIYKIALADGKTLWETNVTDAVWRDDIKQLLLQPYSGPTYDAPQRSASQSPLTGTNVAPAAEVTVKGEGGWFKSDQVQNKAHDLVDDAIDNLSRPWLGIVDQEKADDWSKFVSVEFRWSTPINLRGLSIHEDSHHPESWPYHCCLQAYENGEWHDLAVSMMGPGPWHNIVLSQPKEVSRIRYVPTSIQSNNLWTDEVKVIADKVPGNPQ